MSTLEYFERFRALIEDVIGASVDEALSTQPENPIVTIAAALLKRCKVESAADAALLRSAASSLGMGTAEQFNLLRNQTSTDASGLEVDTAAVDVPFVRRLSSAAVSSTYESVTSEEMDDVTDLKARRLHGMLGELRTLCCDLRETFAHWIAGDDSSNTQGSSSTLLSSKSSKLPEAAVTELRSCLCDAQQLVQVTQEAIHALLADEPTRGRAGFLISLSDRIGAPPSDRKWRDEWNALKLEAIVLSGQGEFASEEYVNESCTVEKTTKQNHAAIVKLVNRGWYPHEAIAYRLLSSVSSSIGRAFREGDACYAASTYALRDALFHAMRVNQRRSLEGGGAGGGTGVNEASAVGGDAGGGTGVNEASAVGGISGGEREGYTSARIVEVVSMDGDVDGDEENEPPEVPLFYWHLEGIFSLTENDAAWSELEVPDRSGFCGLTCSTLVRGTREAACFDADGMLVKVQYPADDDASEPLVQFDSVDSDVVCFVSSPSTWQFHHAIIFDESDERGAFPPNTLFRLTSVDEPGEWVAPGGVRPMRRRLVVTATYNAARYSECSADARVGKLWSEVVLLSYERRGTYVEGLHHLWAKPVLTMYEEFARDYTWTDWKGHSYSLREEFAYVTGPAVRKEGCTPGVRDDGDNEGLTPADFLARANGYINERRARGFGVRLPPQFAELTLDECLAVRLYSGASFQPINDFLRNIAKLSDELRVHMVRHPSLTFAATIGHICRAIRKLAAVATDEESKQVVFRGVRGILPRTFWLPDRVEDMVCAVDMGFMSTSLNERTPINYMHPSPAPNVLWELRLQPESDAGYHVGANIAILSQYAAEEEMLFPPCTMLQVLPATSEGVAAVVAESNKLDAFLRASRDDSVAPTELLLGAAAEGLAAARSTASWTRALRKVRKGFSRASSASEGLKGDQLEAEVHSIMSRYRAQSEKAEGREFLRVCTVPTFS